MSDRYHRYYGAGKSEWVNPVHRGYRMMCCDCRLVHNLDFRIHNGSIQFRVERNNRSTAQARRWKKAVG